VSGGAAGVGSVGDNCRLQTAVRQCLLLVLLYRISHFSASAGKHSAIPGYVINSNRLGGLICNLKSFLTIEHVPKITDFCICMYVLGCKLSLFRLCHSGFGITAVDDITNGIT
jgi:hypothetical protein